MLGMCKHSCVSTGSDRRVTGGEVLRPRTMGQRLGLATPGSPLLIQLQDSRCSQPYQRDTISQSCVAGMQAGDSTTRITGLQLESYFVVLAVIGRISILLLNLPQNHNQR